MATALLLPLERGPRSALVPAACPFDFEDVHPAGGRLVRVVGPPIYPNWSAEYEARVDLRPCPECGVIVGHNVGGTGLDASLLVWDAAPNELERFRWYHAVCAVKAAGLTITAMGTHTKREHPPCAVCGEPWSEHWSFGYESRSCSDTPTDTRLYERAPGMVGIEPIEWLRQAA